MEVKVSMTVDMSESEYQWFRMVMETLHPEEALERLARSSESNINELDAKAKGKSEFLIVNCLTGKNTSKVNVDRKAKSLEEAAAYQISGIAEKKGVGAEELLHRILSDQEEEWEFAAYENGWTFGSRELELKYTPLELEDWVNIQILEMPS